MPSDSRGGVPRQRADDELPDGGVLGQGCHHARVLAQHGPNDRQAVRDHLKGEKEKENENENENDTREEGAGDGGRGTGDREHAKREN